MFEKAVRLAALGMFLGSALLLAFVAVIAGAPVGGAVGYLSFCLLNAMLPQAFERASLDDWAVWFSLGGAFIGVSGLLFWLARTVWMELRNSNDGAVRDFTRRVEKLWRASST